MPIGASAGQRAAENVGIGQRLRRLPPSQVAIGNEIKCRDQRQLDRHKEIAANGAAERSALARPRATR